MSFKVQGYGFRVQTSGFRVYGDRECARPRPVHVVEERDRLVVSGGGYKFGRADRGRCADRVSLEVEVRPFAVRDLISTKCQMIASGQRTLLHS